MTVATALPHPHPPSLLQKCNKKSCQHSQNKVEETAAAVGLPSSSSSSPKLVAAPKPKVKCPWRIYVACGMLHVAILSFFRQCRKRKQQKLIVLESAACIYLTLFEEYSVKCCRAHEWERGGTVVACCCCIKRVNYNAQTL